MRLMNSNFSKQPSFVGKRLRSLGLSALLAAVISTDLHAQSTSRPYGETVGLLDRCIHVIDPATGAVEQVIPTRGASNAQIYFTCLAHDGNRLWSISATTANIPSKMVRVRQADGVIEDIGNTGIKWSWYGLDIDPTTGRMYALCRLAPPQTQVFLYEYDPNLHQLTTVALLSGQLLAVDAFVISPSGQAFAFDPIGPDMYSLDLGTGVATHYGSLSLPGFTGYLWDATFDSAGNLWVSYEDTWTNAETGIYEIDMTTLGHTKIVGLFSPYDGLAWGSVPAVRS